MATAMFAMRFHTTGAAGSLFAVKKTKRLIAVHAVMHIYHHPGTCYYVATDCYGKQDFFHAILQR